MLSGTPGPSVPAVAPPAPPVPLTLKLPAAPDFPPPPPVSPLPIPVLLSPPAPPPVPTPDVPREVPPGEPGTLPAGEIEKSAHRFPVGSATMSEACPGSVLITTKPLPCACAWDSRPAALLASGTAFSFVGAGVGADAGGTGNCGCNFVGSVRSVSGLATFVAVSEGAGAVTDCLFGSAGFESFGLKCT